MLEIEKSVPNEHIMNLCADFINSDRPNYIMGRNERAEAVNQQVDVSGFVDDFTNEKEFLGKPILKSHEVEPESLVLITSICNPFSAQKNLSEQGLISIDYFSFLKYSGLDLPENEFQPGFAADFEKNREKYEHIYALLNDVESKIQFQNLLNFRINFDISYLSGFTNKEKEQYFEDFLNLNVDDEVFVDAGGFDGYTTAEFIKRCPNYRAVHIFEPEKVNLQKAKKNLEQFNKVKFYPLGLYSEKKTFKFSAGGSASRITKDGEVEISVDALDDLIDEAVTFIKMDIEGAEIEAIKGAQHLIKQYKPRLAISAYHKTDDFWKIPETVFSLRNDYKLYLRHYMEGISETVMFFI